MTTETIEQASEQAPAAEALVALIQMFGHLPRPYIVIDREAAELYLQLESPGDFEVWRTALQIAPSDVSIRQNTSRSWLKAQGVFRGVEVALAGFGLDAQAIGAEASAVAA